jgi:hypothetical protein
MGIHGDLVGHTRSLLLRPRAADQVKERSHWRRIWVRYMCNAASLYRQVGLVSTNIAELIKLIAISRRYKQ